MQDLIRDRESFLDGTDDDIFCKDIAALKGAIELIVNGEFPKEQIWIHRNSNEKIDKVSHVVDEGISECVWFEEVDSVGVYITGTCWKSLFLDNSAWSLASASELMSVFWRMFRRLNNIGNPKKHLEVLFTDGSDKIIKDGHRWGNQRRFYIRPRC